MGIFVGVTAIVGVGLTTVSIGVGVAVGDVVLPIEVVGMGTVVGASSGVVGVRVCGSAPGVSRMGVFSVVGMDGFCLET